MARVSGVLTRDTGRDISDILNRLAAEQGFDAVGFLGGAIAESTLCEHAARERAWPDVSCGLWQPIIKFLGTDVPGLTRDPAGAAEDTPENRQIGRDFCFDAERLAAYVAPRYASLLRRWGDPLEAWCRWNAPSIAGVDNPNRSKYAAGLQAAAGYAPKETTVRDLRGQLPTNSEAQYVTRPLDAITGVTLHYTEGPTSQTAVDVAAYQTSEAARPQTGNNTPFPGIAYTFLIDGTGTANQCYDLEVRSWHSAAVVNGLGRNLTHVGICYTGDQQPTDAQIGGIVEAIRWCQDRLGGRQLTIEGHRDPPYPTQCPGPAWNQWRGAVEGALGRTPIAVEQVDPANGFTIGAGFRDFLIGNPEWGKARMSELPMEGGSYVWTTPTPQHPKGALLIYRQWLNSVRPVSWD
jgi:hypothetical protein